MLSDALVVLDTAHGIEVHTDPSVDRSAVEEKTAMLCERLGTPEHDAARQAVVAAQRPRRNTEGGYWIAADDSDAADHALIGTVPLVEVRQGAVLDWRCRLARDLRPSRRARTRRPYRISPSADPAPLSNLAERGPGALIERIRKNEANDPQGERWPRYKISDDATVAACTY